jgi:hypothetical protein
MPRRRRRAHPQRQRRRLQRQGRGGDLQLRVQPGRRRRQIRHRRHRLYVEPDQRHAGPARQAGPSSPAAMRGCMPGDLTTHANWAGGIAVGESIGAGISVSVNNISRQTRALIGEEDATGRQRRRYDTYHHRDRRCTDAGAGTGRCVGLRRGRHGGQGTAARQARRSHRRRDGHLTIPKIRWTGFLCPLCSAK